MPHPIRASLPFVVAALCSSPLAGAIRLPALFSDFVQLDTRIHKRLRGTGLGLSLAKKFSELLGGRVAVQSALGKGSRFSVFIPSHYEPERAA